MKILVVDDEQDVKLLFEQIFMYEIRKKHYEFRFAFSAEEALEYLKTDHAADLVMILSDINMPGMSGIELLSHIKKNYAAIKIFMVTAYENVSNFQAATERGCDGYITKPIDFDTLKQQIATVKATIS